MDYLKECMNDVGNPPLDAMHRNFCLVCANRGCERAGLNQSEFDKRVKNWKSLLFDNVPRADEADDRYSNLRSRNFAPGGPPKPPPTTVFVPNVPAIIRPEEPRIHEPPRPAAFVRAPEAPAAVAPPPTPEPEDTGPPPPPAGAGNTPFEQGMVLDGAPPPAPPRDPSPPQAPGQTFILDDED